MRGLSELTIRNVGVNPTRTGILDVLREMGADISVVELPRRRGTGLRPDRAGTARLHGVEIGGSIIPRLIDELPVHRGRGRACAEGETVIRDAQELKVKESNRIAAMVTELNTRGRRRGGNRRRHDYPRRQNVRAALSFETYKDHRIAMSLAVLALGAQTSSRINDPEVVSISYPDFFDTLKALGG